MRALHVIPAVAERYGGPSAAVVAMSRALREAGVDTLIAASDADGPAARLDVPLGTPTTFRGEPAIFFRRQWSESLKVSLPLARWLSGSVAGFDVVHVHAVFSHACVSAGHACRRSRVPYVVRPLGTLDPWSLAQNPERKRLFWRLAGRRLLAGASAVHYTSGLERRSVESSLQVARGAVIPLGVEEALFSGAGQGPALDEPYVLFLGRLHPKKNVGVLVEAFAALPPRGEPSAFRLVLTGDGESRYVESLRREVARLSLSPRVRFAGWVGGEEKVRLLKGASLFVLPSSQENFAISAAEAMACGVPVIVSPETSLAEDVERANAGWVVPAEARALAAALAVALADPEERARRGERGAELARERFRWPRVARELRGLYASLTFGREPA